MSFRPWSRWKSERTQTGALAQEIARLAGDARVHAALEWFARHEREIAEFQLAITSIPAPFEGEHARAAWLGERLGAAKLSTSNDAAGNLLAWRAGLQTDAECVAISAHLDTVFPASTVLDVRRDHAQLLGPGISDNGAGLSALWALASAFDAAGIATERPLLFVGNVGEEGEGNLRGIRHLYRQPITAVSPAAADNAGPAIAQLVALDGAGSDTIIGQALGSRRFEIAITGPGGHSWSDHGTPNPIVAAALVVAALHRIVLPVNPRTTLNVGMIEGGTSINSIPERAVLRVDLRSSDSRRLDELEQQLRRAVREACAEAEARSGRSQGALSHTIAMVGERPAGELAETSPLLAAVRAVDGHLGIKSQLLRASTDANIPLSLGLEAVTLGGGGTGGGAHTVREWYDPAGREQALKRITLLVLLLAGLPTAEADTNAVDASAASAEDALPRKPESAQ